MDSLPLTFYDSVVALVHEPRGFHVQSRKWKNAFGLQSERQTLLCIVFGCNDSGEWRLLYHDLARHFAKIADVRSVDRSFLRVADVSIQEKWFRKNSAASAEAIEAFKFLLPYFGNTYITLWNLPSMENINHVLPLLQNLRLFSGIEMHNLCAEYEDFLNTQLNSDELKYITVHSGDPSADLLRALGDFALTKEFKSISCPGLHYYQQSPSSRSISLGKASGEYEEFLQNQLRMRDDLKAIQLHGKGWSAEIQEAANRYALVKPSERIFFRDLTFACYERFFEFSLQGHNRISEYRFYATLDDLHDIRQIGSNQTLNDRIRVNNCRATTGRFCKSIISFFFKKSL